MQNVIGIDVGDKNSAVCVLDRSTGELHSSVMTTSGAAVRRRFAKMPPCRIALEVGQHSRWMSQDLRSFGHEVYVANPQQMGQIHGRSRKSDDLDAVNLAKMADYDPALLKPIQHRSSEMQGDLAVVKARDLLVRNRTAQVNMVRKMSKAEGQRLPSCSVEAFPRRVAPQIPDHLRMALIPILNQLEILNHTIRDFDKKIAKLVAKYPATTLLRQIGGVGPITALCFALVIQDPARFQKSRMVGAYLGLVSKKRQSGDVDPELRISKQGDTMLRTMLVRCAHYILGRFGPDTDLKRFGERLASRGRKNAKKRAVVAVARRLAVLLHRLWADQTDYVPLHASATR